MSKILEYFKRKNQFRKAGPGHRLNETAPPPEKNEKSSKKPKSSGQAGISKERERAAAAALERVQQQNQPALNWSSQATRNQAKREIELENAAKEKLSVQPKQTAPRQADPNLTVPGVFFRCPLIGPEVLSKSEMQSKIRSFFYEQLDEERGLTACLMIQTLCIDKDKVKKGVEILARYLTNIIDEPTEEKYRKIRLKNKVFQDKVSDLEGAFDFLLGAGFSREVLTTNGEEEEYFILKDEDLDIEKLQTLKEAILSAEPIVPELDRNLKVLRATEFVENVNLPDDFFRLTVNEVRREQELRTETVETMTQLRTKAMRERDETRERQVYKYTLIRIRFPDGLILQGTFSVYEKFLTVREFVWENLTDPSWAFDLLLPGGIKVSEESQTLLDLNLVPTYVLNFQLSDGSVSSGTAFLNPECMSLLSGL